MSSVMYSIVMFVMLSVVSTTELNRTTEIIYGSENCVYSFKLDHRLVPLIPYRQMFCRYNKLISIAKSFENNIIFFCEQNVGIKYLNLSSKGDKEVVHSLRDVNCQNIAYESKTKLLFYNNFYETKIFAINVNSPQTTHLIIRETKHTIGDIRVDPISAVLIWNHWNADGSDAQFVVSNFDGTNATPVFDRHLMKMPLTFDVDVHKKLIYYVDTANKHLYTVQYSGFKFDDLLSSDWHFRPNMIDAEIAFCDNYVYFHQTGRSIIAYNISDHLELLKIVEWSNQINALICLSYVEKSWTTATLKVDTHNEDKSDVNNINKKGTNNNVSDFGIITSKSDIKRTHDCEYPTVTINILAVFLAISGIINLTFVTFWLIKRKTPKNNVTEKGTEEEIKHLQSNP